MDHIGIDVHRRESQICIITEDGEVIEQRIRTTRDRYQATLGERSAARILIEASTESEWVARLLEQHLNERWSRTCFHPRASKIKSIAVNLSWVNTLGSREVKQKTNRDTHKTHKCTNSHTHTHTLRH